MASIQSVTIGFVIFVSCIACSWMLAYTGGITIDMVYNKSVQFDLKHQDAMKTDFYQATKDLAVGPINLFYLVIYALPIIGAIIFYQSVVKYQGQDTLVAGSNANYRRRRVRR